MDDLEVMSSDSRYFQPLLAKNREWPFHGYAEQMQELNKYFGQELLISRNGFDAINSRTCVVMGLFNINAPYFQIGNPDSLYPHSLVFSDGSATNMKNIGFIGLDKRLRKHLLEFEPFLMMGENSEQKIFGAVKILRDNSAYWNPVMFRNSISAAMESAKMIHKMSEKAAAMGMFD